MVTKALVLGGGGVTGVAWELGVLHGLGDAGVDLGDADLIVGTSAGSVVGTAVASGADLRALLDRQLRPNSRPGGTPTFDIQELGEALLAILQQTQDPREIRTRMGAFACAAETVSEAEQIEVMTALLPVREWPERLLVTAVDTATGDFVTWDRTSGVPLPHAVAASCAVPGVWPPITVGDRRYMDGGLRTLTNADVAAGHDVLVVLAPIPGPGIGSGGVEEEAAKLRARSRVLVVAPDDEALRVLGPNPLDFARRADAALAGQRQGRALGDEVRTAWGL